MPPAPPALPPFPGSLNAARKGAGLAALPAAICSLSQLTRLSLMVNQVGGWRAGAWRAHSCLLTGLPAMSGRRAPPLQRTSAALLLMPARPTLLLAL